MSIKRNGNIEALRCLAMLLIVIYHWTVNLHPIEMDGTTVGTPLWELFFTVLTFWHVDAFIAISGWFGIKFSWQKFLKIWSMIWFYALLTIIAKCLTGETIIPNDFYITGGWFGGTYLGLMLLAPFLNAGIDALVSKGMMATWSVWFLAALALTLNWLPFHIFSCVGVSGFGSHCICTLIFVYVTARLLRLTGFVEHVRLHHLCMVVVFLFASVAFWGCAKNIFQLLRGNAFEWGRFYWQTSYDAPHIWLMAIAMLVLFAKFLSIPTWLQHICVMMGPSVFAVYLTHNCLAMRTYVGYPIIGYLRGILPEPIAIAALGIIIFIVSIAVDFIRRACLLLVKRGYSSCNIDYDNGNMRMLVKNVFSKFSRKIDGL